MKKWYFLSLLLLLSHASSAEENKRVLPIEFTVVPTISNMDAGNIQTVQYTIKSYADKQTFPLAISVVNVGDDMGDIITIVDSVEHSCGAELEPHATCNISVDIAPIEEGIIKRQLRIDYQSSFSPLTSPIDLTVSDVVLAGNWVLEQAPTNILSIAASSTYKSNLFYVGASEQGIYGWDGTEWIGLPAFAAPQFPYSIADVAGILFITDGSQVYAYDNVSETWNDIGSPTDENISYLLNVSDTLYAATEGTGVWKYDENWMRAGSNEPGNGYVATLAVIDDTVYAGNNDGTGVWRLIENTWEHVSGRTAIPHSANITTIIDADGTLLAGTDNSGVWSYTAETGWSLYGRNYPADGFVASLAYVDEILYAADPIENAGVYSLSSGVWRPLNTQPGLGDTVVLANVAGTLYAGNQDDTGTWQYDPSTPSWNQLGTSPFPDNINTVFENENGDILVGVEADINGVWILSAGTWEAISGGPGRVTSIIYNDNSTEYLVGSKDGNIYSYNGTLWTNLGSPSGAPVNVLLVYSDYILAGVDDEQGVYYYDVTDINPSWMPAGSDNPPRGYVSSLIFYEFLAEPYVLAGSTVAGAGVWIWDYVADGWEQFPKNSNPAIPGNGIVESIINIGDDDVFVGMGDGTGVWEAVWDGNQQNWEQLGSNIPGNGYISSIIYDIDDYTLFAGNKSDGTGMWIYDYNNNIWDQVGTYSPGSGIITSLIEIDTLIYTGTPTGLWSFDTSQLTVPKK